jgi:drug/metabolite transporter (DMT)-like permease
MTFLWAINFVIAKIALRELPPLLVASLRTALASLVILPIYFWNARKNGSVRWNRADLPTLVYLGLFGVALNQVFFILGLSRTSVAHAAIIIGITPILVLIIATFLGQESIKAAKVAGMGIALLGVAILQADPNKVVGSTILGDCFVFLGALTFAIFTVFGKRVTSQFGSITMNTFAYVSAGLIMMPVTLWYSTRLPLSHISSLTWATVFYMAAFPSVLCYLIYYYALSHIAASRVSAFSYLQPFLATLAALPILGERPTSSLLIGGSFVLAGVFVAERV